ncbi:hypothetical protein PENANT_c020G04321 [Penicillium antarcticum]|uniref:Uncharacterized protein n=1 Tax=Penicillium antarcticum TaxID=416450 RepID=A0A1V6Q0G5_9EURO|nr:hypothetical protein PENANT_c020G04321 [Penicillium antarcticum]
MVYYVQFLKTPRVQQKKGTLFITALICITTDLGDDFLAEDVELLVSSTHKSPGIEQKVTWNAGNRELAINLGPLPSAWVQQSMELSAKLQPEATGDKPLVPLVMAATSAPFGLKLPAEKLVRRDGPIKGLSIWEETGNSIARHIWDAGLASVIYLQKTLDDMKATNGKQKHKQSQSTIPALTRLLSTIRSSPLQVVELGAGCGIVGIALASMLPNCSVLLTDLPEVESIITRNIEEAQTAPQSSVEYQNLDWDSPPDDLCSRPIELILVSDCTYNADSLPALVNVLDRLVRTSPDAIILVALKRRHDSETAFFDLMGSAGFTAVKDSMQLPSQHDQVDEIQFYCYSRTTEGKE